MGPVNQPPGFPWRSFTPLTYSTYSTCSTPSHPIPPPPHPESRPRTPWPKRLPRPPRPCPRSRRRGFGCALFFLAGCQSLGNLEVPHSQVVWIVLSWNWDAEATEWVSGSCPVQSIPKQVPLNKHDIPIPLLWQFFWLTSLLSHLRPAQLSNGTGFSFPFFSGSIPKNILCPILNGI